MDMPEVITASVGSRQRQISEPSSSVVIERPGHAAALLIELDVLRSDANSADTVLIAEGKEFPCHRALLSASSQYFRLMFGGRLKESHERRIDFDGVTALALGRIVDFVYSGLIKVTVDDAQELLAAACLFQYSEIVDECCKFLSTHLHPTNCLAIEAFAQLHSCTQLEEEARRFTKENFASVALDSEEFLELTAERLESYISNNDIEVRMEEAVFEAVVRWVDADIDARLTAVCDLLRHVRFDSIDADYLESTVIPHCLVAQCPNCSALVAEVTRIHSHSPRPSTIAKEVMVVIGGYDVNGSVLDSVEAYVPSKDSWQQLARIPVAVACCSVAAAENDIFVSGGIVKGEVVSSVWRFISEHQKWLPACPLLAPRAYHASAASGTRLYVVGGKRSTSSSYDVSTVETVECIDIGDSNSRWRVMASVPFPRHNSHMVAYGDDMLVEVGGIQVGAGIVKTIETYVCRDNSGYISYSGEQFVLPEPIRHAQLAAIGTMLYIVWTDTTRMISLNSERRVFRRLADINHRHIGGGATVVCGRVYIAGGSVTRNVEDSAATDVVECYDAETNRWTVVRPMLYARKGHGCVTVRMR